MKRRKLSKKMEAERKAVKRVIRDIKRKRKVKNIPYVRG